MRCSHEVPVSFSPNLDEACTVCLIEMVSRMKERIRLIPMEHRAK